MISRLPRWVESGAFTLALVAGSVNAVGLLGFQHQAISHLSGTATLLGAGLFGAPTFTLHLLGILASFVAGAALTGFVIRTQSVKIGRHYDTLLYIEAALLIISIALLQRESALGHYAASAACGLQNALATRYSGAIVRTTHVTGIFTDLGIMLGAAVRGQRIDQRKMILFTLIVLGFVTGGTLGAALFAHAGFLALALPATICIALASWYRLYRLHRYRQQRPRKTDA